jgi:uncharacterized protein (DUF2141 family)
MRSKTNDWSTIPAIMEMNCRGWLRLVLACAVISMMAARTSGVDSLKISGRVTGGSGKHTIYVALWDAESFLKQPVQRVRIEPGTTASFQFQIAAGRWALSAFEDQNDNGVLDMGVFGPKEPSGFWHAFRAWRKPRFDDVAVQVDRDITDANIELKK